MQDTKAMHDTIGVLFGLYASCFCGVCFAWYADHLAKRRFRISFWLMAISYASWRQLAPLFIDDPGANSGPPIIRGLLLIVVSLGLLYAFYRPYIRTALYTVLSWAGIFELSFFIAYTVLFLSDPVYAHMADQILIAGPTADTQRYLEEIMTAAYVFEAVMVTILSGLCVFSCRSISRNFPRRKRDLTPAEFRLLVLPALTGMLIGILLRMLIITLADGVPIFLFDEYPPLKALVPAIAVIALLGIVYAVHTVKDMDALEGERRSRLVAEERLRALREQVKETERLTEHVARMRHDLKNTLTVIAALSENIPEGEALSAYLSDLNQDMGALERQFDTGDPVADILLTSKAHALQKSAPGASLDASELILPADDAISSYDLGIVLGNALDNAVRAVSRQPSSDERFIILRSFKHGQLFFLTVQNSFDGQEPAISEEGLPISMSGEGLGMRNIRTIATKYDGAMDWKAENGVFTLSVMLSLPALQQDTMN